MSKAENVTDAIVAMDDLMGVSLEIHNEGLLAAQSRLKKIEPSIAVFLNRTLTHAAGEMVLAGLPQPAVVKTVEQFWKLSLILLHAERRAQVRLWRGSLSDSALAKLDALAIPMPPPKSDPSDNPF